MLRWKNKKLMTDVGQCTSTMENILKSQNFPVVKNVWVSEFTTCAWIHHEVPVGGHTLYCTKHFRFQSLQGVLECTMKSLSLYVSSSDADNSQKQRTHKWHQNLVTFDWFSASSQWAGYDEQRIIILAECLYYCSLELHLLVELQAFSQIRFCG